MSRTHRVTNQAAPRVDVNEFTSNHALVAATRRYGAGWAADALTTVGALVGQGDVQRDAELANRRPPEFAAHDRWGHRVDHIEFHPAYHRIMAADLAHGGHTSCWADRRPGAHVARAATFSLFAQVEAGHSCPVSMTHAAVPSLELDDDLAAQWLPKVYSRSYDPREIDPAAKSSALFGMAMTEKQGGSDVRANTTTAAQDSDGTWLLTGHKWFCSAPQSDAFLVTAQAPEGLTCFVVPRRLGDDEPNGFFVQRLKDKLGNTSNASSEIELDGARGWLLGEPGRGVKAIIEMVNQTRLDCVIGSAAGMRQSVAEAAWHARHRAAFGATLIHQPAMAAVIADLQLEAEAAVWTAMRLAAAYDDASAASTAFRRLATAVAKYWVCKRGPHHAYEAMECLGGNGYTELFPLARRYREQPVMAIWEGSGNVIALDVLRAMQREPDSVDAFVAEVGMATGQDRIFDAHVSGMHSLVAAARDEPDASPALARRLVESMALALQGSILIREAPPAVAQAFVAARLGPDRCLEYGALPPGLDVAGLAGRA